MSKVAKESVLDDFDQEESGEEQEEEEVQPDVAGDANKDGEKRREGGLDGAKMDEELVERLSGNSKFQDRLRAVKEFRDGGKLVGPADSSPHYQMVVVCNEMCVEIDQEIERLHGLILDRYSTRFPELASHVMDKMDYVKAVRMIGNHTDVAGLDLSSVLSSAQIMAVSMTGSKFMNGDGNLLPDALLQAIFAACDRVQFLDEIKETVLLPFVKSQMPIIAPNLTAILGSEIAAQLLSIVGGLRALTNIPSCNVQVIGKGHQALHGFARVASMRHNGVICGCPLVQECSADHQRKAMRVVGGRLILAARLDQARSDPAGQAGKKWHDEIRDKLKKWHGPKPGRTKRPLPVPIDQAKKRRGGRRARRLKEIFGESEIQKQMNRVQFAVKETEEYGDSAMGKGMGMLGKEGSGVLRVMQKKVKQLGQKQIDFNKYKNSQHVNRFSVLNEPTEYPSAPADGADQAKNLVTDDTSQSIHLSVSSSSSSCKKSSTNQKPNNYFGTTSFSFQKNKQQ